MTLRYEETAKDVYDALKKVPRTGWVIRGVPNPETVYDHTVSLIKLADEMSAELKLTEKELDDLKHILEIHDWAEAVVGDEYIPNEDQKSYDERKIEKAKREREELTKILENKPYKEVITQLFERYESGSDKIAKLAKQLDKLQALMLAGEYEEKYGIPLFDVFDQYYVRDNSFTDEVIKTHALKLREKYTK